jgi:PadR family transcriptional regulator PadR
MITKELAAASSTPIILAILSKEDDYGYSIIQRVRAASHGQIEWSEGMLYPVLHRLEDDGQIRAIWKTAENGRRRKYYRLSVSGRKSLVSHRQHWGTQPCST